MTYIFIAIAFIAIIALIVNTTKAKSKTEGKPELLNDSSHQLTRVITESEPQISTSKYSKNETGRIYSNKNYLSTHVRRDHTVITNSSPVYDGIDLVTPLIIIDDLINSNQSTDYVQDNNYPSDNNITPTVDTGYTTSDQSYQTYDTPSQSYESSPSYDTTSYDISPSIDTSSSSFDF